MPVVLEELQGRGLSGGVRVDPAVPALHRSLTGKGGGHRLGEHSGRVTQTSHVAEDPLILAAGDLFRRVARHDAVDAGGVPLVFSGGNDVVLVELTGVVVDTVVDVVVARTVGEQLVCVDLTILLVI